MPPPGNPQAAPAAPDLLGGLAPEPPVEGPRPPPESRVAVLLQREGFVAGAKIPPHDDALGETMPAASGAVVNKVAESGGASPLVKRAQHARCFHGYLACWLCFGLFFPVLPADWSQRWLMH